MKLTKTQIEQALKVLEKVLLLREDVVFAYLYGSTLSFLEGKQVILPRDIDVAIYIRNADILKTETELQLAFYQKTGLLPEILDIRSFNQAPLSARIEILTKGELIFCQDELFHAEYVEETSNLYRELSGLIEAAYA